MNASIDAIVWTMFRETPEIGHVAEDWRELVTPAGRTAYVLRYRITRTRWCAPARGTVAGTPTSRAGASSGRQHPGEQVPGRTLVLRGRATETHDPAVRRLGALLTIAAVTVASVAYATGTDCPTMRARSARRCCCPASAAGQVSMTCCTTTDASSVTWLAREHPERPQPAPGLAVVPFGEPDPVVASPLLALLRSLPASAAGPPLIRLRV